MVETAVADNGALPPIQIQHGGKRQVDAAGGKFGSQHPADLFGLCLGRIGALFVPNPAQHVHGGQTGETVDKTLHAAAFVVDRHNQFGRAHGFDFAHQLFELRHVFEIAAEQNHAADGRVKQTLFFFVGQTEGVDIGHYRAARDDGSGHFVLSESGRLCFPPL